MLRVLILLALWVLSSSLSTAQPLRTFTITPGYATRSITRFDLGGGDQLAICDRAFGYDSSRVEFVWNNSAMQVTDAVSHRLHMPLTFLNSAVALNDGYLVAGGNYYSGGTMPFLLKTDPDGAVEWYRYFSNLGDQQDQVMRALPRGAEFTAYTYPGGTYTTAVHRIEGEATGTTFSAMRIAAPAGITFRLYEALQLTAPMEHLLGGTGNSNVMPPVTRDALLMRTDASGGAWMKLYDIGVGSQIEDLNGVQPTADGNFLCAGYYTTGGSGFEGFVMKVDPVGAVLWCRKYMDSSGGLMLYQAKETGSGEILVSGENGAYQGMLLRLDASGAPLSSERFINDRLRRFQQTAAGWILTGLASLLELGPDGTGCDFASTPLVTSVAYTPTVTPITLTNTAFTPTTAALNHYDRAPELGWAQTCI